MSPLPYSVQQLAVITIYLCSTETNPNSCIENKLSKITQRHM